MNFYIGDMHLFHANVTKEGKDFDGRPFQTLEEMHNVFKDNWNTRITNADHVYLDGDTSWKTNDDSIAYISTLKGNKHLIIGNHDRPGDLRFNNLFTEIVNYKEVTDKAFGHEFRVILSHFPIMFWNGQRRDRIINNVSVPRTVHLYAHVHNTSEEILYQKFIEELNTENGYNCIAINVGAMLHDYTPKTLEELLGDEFRLKYLK